MEQSKQQKSQQNQGSTKLSYKELTKEDEKIRLEDVLYIREQARYILDHKQEYLGRVCHDFIHLPLTGFIFLGDGFNLVNPNGDNIKWVVKGVERIYIKKDEYKLINQFYDILRTNIMVVGDVIRNCEAIIKAIQQGEYNSDIYTIKKANFKKIEENKIDVNVHSELFVEGASINFEFQYILYGEIPKDEGGHSLYELSRIDVIQNNDPKYLYQLLKAVNDCDMNKMSGFVKIKFLILKHNLFHMMTHQNVADNIKENDGFRVNDLCSKMWLFTSEDDHMNDNAILEF